ncbi:MAG: NADH-quinone oxidoreductase subunit J [Solirubrobacteraceae bacterium]
MAEIVFFIAGIGAVAGAIGVIAFRNAFYSVLSLVFHLLSLAALFLLLRAQFVAAAQVVVYAGAVMVLYVFVVAYVGGEPRPLTPYGAGLVPLASVFAAALAVELLIALLGSGLQFVDSRGAPYAAGFGTPGQIGELFLTRFLLAFEVASYLLLVAAVGAVILARRRRGLPEEPGQEPQRHVASPRLALVGTMAETVHALPTSERAPTPRGGW